MPAALPHAEWEAEARSRFGDDKMQWAFVCPICKTVTGVEEYRAFKALGATPEDAGYNCIGRFMPRALMHRAFSTTKQKKTGPCDYTAGGLFRFAPVRVLLDDGRILSVFDFALATLKDTEP